jgi:transcriptional regulator with XRE-family HTH domain
LAQYHLHPESKFHNGDYLDSGVTGRRHIVATVVEQIGKEANRWEEQYYLGLDFDALTEYGTSPEDSERAINAVAQAAKKYGQRALAKAAKVSLREVSSAVHTEQELTPTTLGTFSRAVARLEAADREPAEHLQELLETVRKRCQHVGVRRLAAYSGVDGTNLARVLSGRRKPSEAMLVRLEEALA